MVTHRELANAIRMLSVDAVQRANSGHPGMPMGMADIAEVLWNGFLRHNPNNPKWPNRDRFLLSNGHGSMLQYALLHLSGYDLSIDDLKNFRQLHSKTPGHPEVDQTPGVETTTGPLGQGLANAVGMAIAERTLGAQFNRDDFNLIDHFTYVFAGDGCLMEGISHEVCSLAGTLGLGKLIVFWDDNHISIDGNVAGWFTDDTPKRFESYGWQVIRNVDGHNADAIRVAIETAQQDLIKPTLICCHTTIGFGSPHKANTASVHGSPLGDEEIAATRKQLNWPYEPFEIPVEIHRAFDARDRGEKLEEEWKALFDQYHQRHPAAAKELERRWNQQLPSGFEDSFNAIIQEFLKDNAKLATRQASQQVLEKIAPMLPELLGGSADLTGSNLTNWSGTRAITHDQADGNYIHYGVREFGMSAIMNGMTLYGSFIPYGGTFLVFYTYAANAVRMAALMKKRVIFIYSHDSIGLGEDGPTHQPIEQAAALRMTPNISTWRPCDLVETAVAWKLAIERCDGPTALLLSRQGLPAQKRTCAQTDLIRRGGYILRDVDSPECILIATGSEVSLAMAAAEALKDCRIRVVSMPSPDIFLQQDATYLELVLPAAITRRVAIEMGTTAYWQSWVGSQGHVIGLDHFGESAPAKDLFEELGFTVEHVIEVINMIRGNL